MEGYKWLHNTQILSIISAPNYCFRCGNVGAIAHISESMECHIRTYEPSTRSVPPDFNFL